MLYLKKSILKNFAIILSSFLILTGFTTSRERINLTDPSPITEGQLIYQENGCATCHGHQGLGDGILAKGLNPKPRDFTSYDEMNRVPFQSMYSAIKEGIPFTAMPSFNLSDTQIRAVISYIRSFLTENYVTINACLNTSKVVSLKKANIGENFNIEMDHKNFVTTSLNKSELTLTPNISPIQKFYKDENKQMVRVHVSLTKNDKDKKKYLAIIALRIRNCIK